MFTTLKICNFGTLYLWIFVLKVLIVLPHLNDGYKIADKGGGPLLIKPYPYQLMQDTDDLLNEHSSSGPFAAIPVWPNYMQDKHQHQQQQHPHTLHSGVPVSLAIPAKNVGGSDIWLADGRELGRRQEAYPPMTSNEIDFETLNDFDINLIRNAIWLPASPKYLNERNNKQLPLLQHHRLTTGRPLAETPANIRYGKDINLPMFMGKRRDKLCSTSFLEQLRKEEHNDNNDDDDDDDDDDDGDQRNDYGNGAGIVHNHKNQVADDDSNDADADDVNDASEAKDDEFTSKDNDTKNNKANTETPPSNSGDGNDSLHYAVGKEILRNNNNDHNKVKELEYLNIHDSRKRSKDAFRDKKKPKSLATTPFLPAVSGGAMTNLGKFFRDLSKNVQFSEKYQWTSEEQKLLEGDPSFGNLQHHLSEPHLKSDQTGEWIKAIRFYRPSQKIRSLVAMNPHGQWAHGSQFIDPNYMWVGLGK